MKILLDECLPVKLKNEFQDLDVHTVHDMNWIGEKDKTILSNANKNGFDIFITIDEGITKQINIDNYDLAIILIKVTKNTMDSLIPIVHHLKEKLQEVEKKKFYRISKKANLERLD